MPGLFRIVLWFSLLCRESGVGIRDLGIENRDSRIGRPESRIGNPEAKFGESGFEIRESGVNIGINGDSGEHRLPLDYEQGGRCEQDDHRALDVDHDALDEDRDHHELDALALHNPLVSPSMP